LGQESSQRSARPRRGDPPPSYAEGSEEEEIKEEEGIESDDDDEVEDDTYVQPTEPPRAMGRAQLKRRLVTCPIPRRATKPPTYNKAERPIVHLPSINKELHPTIVPKSL
jgi:hypothetical protein